ncbi:MAG: bacteriohemerythrin [Calditrichia bacterium]
MALIEWNDTLSVKVHEIDLQHKKLVALINELNDAMRQGKGKEVVGKIINDLINYTLTHFQTEEKYFDRFDYPETESHKKEHANFVSKVSEFQDKFEKGSFSLSIEVLNFLSNWLRSHIKGTDMKYSQFFRDNGLR